MSVNNARRRQTTVLHRVATGPQRDRQIHTLIALRDQLAAAAAAHEAHGLDGELDLLQQQWHIEEAIRQIAPTIYARRWTDWLEYDAALAHRSGDNHPRCYICSMAQAA